MHTRSLGTLTLAFTAVMVALHAQLAAVVLMLGGGFFSTFGSVQGAAALVLGIVYLGIAVAAYATAAGTWLHKPWAWTVGMAAFGTLIAASLLLTILSGSLMAAPLPLILSGIGIGLLTRPAIKAEMLGGEVPETQAVSVDGGEVPEPAH